MSLSQARFLLLIGVALLLVVSCTKEVAIPIQPYQSKLSIQCLITPGKAATVNLYRTVPFFDTDILPTDLFIRTAAVSISTIEGIDLLSVDSIWNPFRCYFEYFYKGKTLIEPSKTYTLSIVYDGATYTSTATTNRRIVQIDSVTYSPKFKDLYGEHEGIQLHFNDPAGQGEYYRFNMGRTFTILDTIFGPGKTFSACSLGKNTWLQEIGRTIYSDKDIDGSSFTITVEPTYKHKKGQVGFVRLQTMDKAAFDFYDQFDRQKLAQYNPFVEPVFILPGQFGTHAFGVFGTYVVSDSIRFEYPE
jgi:Domain of unknown function (DUF4249)